MHNASLTESGDSKTNRRPTLSCRRRATIYVMVLGTALLVALIGISAMTAVRVRQRSVTGGNSAIVARHCAQSAVELGLLTLKTDTAWRTSKPNGVWISDQNLGSGTLTLEVTDPNDADLADSDAEAVIMTGTGNCAEARYQLQVTLVPTIEPLEALSTCLHSGGNIMINNWRVLDCRDAPVSTNARLTNVGYLYADVEANSVLAIRSISGTITAPAPSKDLPDPEVIEEYLALATAIPFTGTLQRAPLTSTYNPWGAANTDGVYSIDTGGSNLNISALRLDGTLLINTRGGTVYLGQDVHFKPARKDYPTLIVNGNLQLQIDCLHPLRESSWGINFNPPNAPYEGHADADTIDEYPNAIYGLIHVTGNLVIEDDTLVHGVIICNGSVTFNEDLTIEHDPDLVANPPLHYTCFGTPAIAPGTWRQSIPPSN